MLIVTVDVEAQVRAYSEHFIGLSDPISLDEITASVEIGRIRETGAQAGSRNRNGGWAWLLAAAAAVLLLVGVVPSLVQNLGGSDADPQPDLGVFAPLKGRIVVVHGTQLEGIDPTESTPPIIVDIPDLPPLPDEACSGWSSGPCDDGAGSLMPVGWSSDGTVMALESEYAGMTYLMDENGTMTRIPLEQMGLGRGCCLFVTGNWLSPDGMHAAFGKGLGVAIIDLSEMSIESEAELDPDEFPGLEGFGQIYVPTWSPDGSRVAFVAASYENDVWTHTIQIYTLADDTVEAFSGPQVGHIRNLAWSPDGTQLLVIGGDEIIRNDNTTMSNPFTGFLTTSLHLVEVDGGSSHAISTGLYVAAAWSLDGSQIAAVDRSNDLTVINADGTNQRTISELTGYGYDNLFTGVTWHPTP